MECDIGFDFLGSFLTVIVILIFFPLFLVFFSCFVGCDHPKTVEDFFNEKERTPISNSKVSFASLFLIYSQFGFSRQFRKLGIRGNVKMITM